MRRLSIMEFMNEFADRDRFVLNLIDHIESPDDFVYLNSAKLIFDGLTVKYSTSPTIWFTSKNGSEVSFRGVTCIDTDNVCDGIDIITIVCADVVGERRLSLTAFSKNIKINKC